MKYSSLIKIFPGYLILLSLLLVSSLAFLRIYSRVKITLLGYEIGRMREIEEQLLKKRSLLTMEHAKLTTWENLEARVRSATKKVDSPVPLADR